MQLNSRQLVTQFAHMLQEELFPLLQTVTGPLGGRMQLLAFAISLAPLGRLLSARRAATGRPAKDRAALATAFMAKAILNLPTTRDLISRLQVHEALRQYCGWRTVRALPHESKFSRAFAEFAQTAGRKKGSRGGIVRAKAADRGTRIQRQRHQKLERQLQDLPQGCDRGAKTNSQAEAPIKGPSQGREQYGRSYKLHLDVADGQIPVSAVLTSASVYDSQVAIPLMTMTSGRVVHLYELMDSAYDADAIHAHSRQLNHVPIIAPHPRRGTKKPSQMQKVFPDKPTPQLTWAQQDRYKERTMSGRVNARLKDEFGASHIRVRGAAKVMAHLMFGVLALTIDPWLRLGTPG